MTYRVQMIDQAGKKTKTVMQVKNEHEIVDLVKAQGCYLLDYEVFEGKQTTKKVKKLKMKSANIFCYQLSTMLSSGINLLDSLHLVQSKAKNDKERAIYRNLYEEVQKGNSLSVAMSAQGGVFDDFLISMVKSGEMGGDLDASLRTMSEHYDKSQKINAKIKTASMYPTILLGVAITVVLALVLFVLPTITANFEPDDMPGSTRFLMGISDFILTKWYLLIGILLILIVVGKVLYDTPRIKIRVHKRLLHLPVVGPLLQTIYSSRCARSFSSLYNHGVSTLDMIELTSEVVGNAYLSEELLKIKQNVTNGSSISESIANVKEFESMFGSMLKVGEETGSLGDILGKTAQYLDDEADAAITRLIGLIEPIMIVVMGIIVAFIVISIIQPIFKMYDTVQ